MFKPDVFVSCVCVALVLVCFQSAHNEAAVMIMSDLVGTTVKKMQFSKAVILLQETTDLLRFLGVTA